MEKKCKARFVIIGVYLPKQKDMSKKAKHKARIKDLERQQQLDKETVTVLNKQLELARLPVVDLPYGERAVFRLLDNRTNVEGNHVGVIDNIEMVRIPSNSVSCSDAFEMTIKIQIER